MTASGFEIEHIVVHPNGHGDIVCNRPPHQHFSMQFSADDHPALKELLPRFVEVCEAAVSEIALGLIPEVPDRPPAPDYGPCRICGARTPNNVEKSPGRWRCPDHAS